MVYSRLENGRLNLGWFSGTTSQTVRFPRIFQEPIVIFRDSHAALQAISSIEIKSTMELECIRILTGLPVKITSYYHGFLGIWASMEMSQSISQRRRWRNQSDTTRTVLRCGPPHFTRVTKDRGKGKYWVKGSIVITREGRKDKSQGIPNFQLYYFFLTLQIHKHNLFIIFFSDLA